MAHRYYGLGDVFGNGGTTDFPSYKFHVGDIVSLKRKRLEGMIDVLETRPESVFHRGHVVAHVLAKNGQRFSAYVKDLKLLDTSEAPFSEIYLDDRVKVTDKKERTVNRVGRVFRIALVGNRVGYGLADLGHIGTFEHASKKALVAKKRAIEKVDDTWHFNRFEPSARRHVGVELNDEDLRDLYSGLVVQKYVNQAIAFDIDLARKQRAIEFGVEASKVVLAGKFIPNIDLPRELV